MSKKDILQDELASIFGVPKENVDVFTVLNSLQIPDPTKVDVRYSVHNSPYWKSERLDGALSEQKDRVSAILPFMLNKPSLCLAYLLPL